MPHTCRGDKLEYSVSMKKLCALLLLFVVGLALTGCQTSHSGSREYVPGKGWIHTD
jgi:hypothetical protein